MSKDDIEKEALGILESFGRYDEQAKCYFMVCGGYVEGRNRFNDTKDMMKAIVDKLKQDSV